MGQKQIAQGQGQKSVGPLDMEKLTEGSKLFEEKNSLMDAISSSVDKLSGGQDLTPAKARLLQVFKGPAFSQYADSATDLIGACKDAGEVDKLAKTLSKADTLFRARSKGMTVEEFGIANEIKKVLAHEDITNPEYQETAKKVNGDDVLLLRVQRIKPKDDSIPVHDLDNLGALDADAGKKKDLDRVKIDKDYITDLRADLFTAKRVGREFGDNLEKGSGQESPSAWASDMVKTIAFSKTDDAKEEGIKPVDIFTGAMIVGKAEKFKGQKINYLAEGREWETKGAQDRGDEIARYAHEFQDEPGPSIQERPKHVLEVGKRANAEFSKLYKLSPTDKMNSFLAEDIIGRLTNGVRFGDGITHEIDQIEKDVMKTAEKDVTRRAEQLLGIKKILEDKQKMDQIRDPRRNFSY